MRSSRSTSILIAMAVVAAVSANPAAAQGKGKAKQQADRRDGTAQESVWGTETYGSRPVGNGAGKVPPGWCRGEGNPHRTVENCGYQANDRRYEDDGYGYPGSPGGDAYYRQHEDFHRYLDDKYARLAAQRPSDITYQLRLRAEKSSEHRQWHDRMGVAH